MPPSRPVGEGVTHSNRVTRDRHEFLALAEIIPAILFIHQDGKFCYVNREAEKILGYSRAELLNMKFWDVIHPAFRGGVRRRGLDRQEGKAVPIRTDFQILNRQGETRWLECCAARIEFRGRSAVLGSAFDVTETKRGAEALIESERRFR